MSEKQAEGDTHIAHYGLEGEAKRTVGQAIALRLILTGLQMEQKEMGQTFSHTDLIQMHERMLAELLQRMATEMPDAVFCYAAWLKDHLPSRRQSTD